MPYPFVRDDGPAIGSGGRRRGKPNFVPTAAFTWQSQTSGTNEEEVCFTNTSTPPEDQPEVPLSYQWSFGGVPSGDSTETNPCHTFPGPGTYQVTLTVTTPDGKNATVTRQVTVGTSGGTNSPTADLEATPSAQECGQQSATITWDATPSNLTKDTNGVIWSSSTALEYQWQIAGDASQDSTQPTTTFTTTGYSETAEITLTITDTTTDPPSSATATKTLSVLPGPTQPEIDVTLNEISPDEHTLGVSYAPIPGNDLCEISYGLFAYDPRDFSYTAYTDAEFTDGSGNSLATGEYTVSGQTAHTFLVEIPPSATGDDRFDPVQWQITSEYKDCRGICGTTAPTASAPETLNPNSTATIPSPPTPIIETVGPGTTVGCTYTFPATSTNVPEEDATWEVVPGATAPNLQTPPFDIPINLLPQPGTVVVRLTDNRTDQTTETTFETGGYLEPETGFEVIPDPTDDPLGEIEFTTRAGITDAQYRPLRWNDPVNGVQDVQPSEISYTLTSPDGSKQVTLGPTNDDGTGTNDVVLAYTPSQDDVDNHAGEWTVTQTLTGCGITTTSPVETFQIKPSCNPLNVALQRFPVVNMRNSGGVDTQGGELILRGGQLVMELAIELDEGAFTFEETGTQEWLPNPTGAFYDPSDPTTNRTITAVTTGDTTAQISATMTTALPSGARVQLRTTAEIEIDYDSGVNGQWQILDQKQTRLVLVQTTGVQDTVQNIQYTLLNANLNGGVVQNYLYATDDGAGDVTLVEETGSPPTTLDATKDVIIGYEQQGGNANTEIIETSLLAEGVLKPEFGGGVCGQTLANLGQQGGGGAPGINVQGTAALTDPNGQNFQLEASITGDDLGDCNTVEYLWIYNDGTTYTGNSVNTDIPQPPPGVDDTIEVIATCIDANGEVLDRNKTIIALPRPPPPPLITATATGDLPSCGIRVTAQPQAASGPIDQYSIEIPSTGFTYTGTDPDTVVPFTEYDTPIQVTATNTAGTDTAEIDNDWQLMAPQGGFRNGSITDDGTTYRIQFFTDEGINNDNRYYPARFRGRGINIVIEPCVIRYDLINPDGILADSVAPFTVTTGQNATVSALSAPTQPGPWTIRQTLTSPCGVEEITYERTYQNPGAPVIEGTDPLFSATAVDNGDGTTTITYNFPTTDINGNLLPEPIGFDDDGAAIQLTDATYLNSGSLDPTLPPATTPWAPTSGTIDVINTSLVSQPSDLLAPFDIYFQIMATDTTGLTSTRVDVTIPWTPANP